MTQYIEFDEVVSQSATEEEPLGTLAGRGKNTLGDNNKMNVRLHSYNMSNHDLSFVFRNTQSPGTLVPFMKTVAQKGDVFDIQLINKTLTHPTVGPLFGSYKLQHFIFTCPIRLYNSWLHNNRTGIGMKMSDIKFPTFSHYAVVLKTDKNGKPIYRGFYYQYANHIPRNGR